MAATMSWRETSEFNTVLINYRSGEKIPTVCLCLICPYNVPVLVVVSFMTFWARVFYVVEEDALHQFTWMGAQPHTAMTACHREVRLF